MHNPCNAQIYHLDVHPSYFNHVKKEMSKIKKTGKIIKIKIPTVDSHYSELEGTSSKVHYIRRFIITRVDTLVKMQLQAITTYSLTYDLQVAQAYSYSTCKRPGIYPVFYM